MFYILKLLCSQERGRSASVPEQVTHDGMFWCSDDGAFLHGPIRGRHTLSINRGGQVGQGMGQAGVVGPGHGSPGTDTHGDNYTLPPVKHRLNTVLLSFISLF